MSGKKNEVIPTTDYWRERGGRGDARADQMSNADAKAAMLAVAAIYERMAKKAAQAEKRQRPN
jgi:hypothetical protein